MGANAQTSVPAFVTGQVLTAEQQTWINTGVPVFATTTTRDAAFGGTGEKVLAEGQMAYIEASNTAQFYDGSAWQTFGPAGMSLVTSGSFSAVTAVTVNDCFTSAFRNYRLDVHLTATSGGAVEGQILLRAAGSNSSTTYYYARSGAYYTGTTIAECGANTSRWYIGRSQGSADAGGSNGFSITIFAPAIADRTWYVGNAADALYSANVGGYHNTQTAYDGFNLSYGGNNMTGTYRVYGLKDSV